MNQEFLNQICSIAGSDNVRLDEPMKKHTTFRIGGTADCFVTPHSRDEIAKVVGACRESGVPYYILGHGSNLLVSDRGWRGVIIQIYKNFSDISVEGTCLTAKAGALLSRVANEALKHSLAGLEFAAGIPGTVGGASVMNAGA